MTFKQLQEEVVARGFQNIADEEGGEARIKRWINQAYREIVDDRAWAFLEATKEGAAPFAIADLGHVLSAVNVTSEAPLAFIDRAELTNQDPALVSTGIASLWFLENGTQLCVHPLDTGSTIRVRYLKLPADLAADGDEPVIPVAYHGVIEDGAVVRAYKTTDNYEAGQFVRQEWERGMKGMRKGLRKSYAGNRKMVRSGNINDYLG